MQKRVNMAGPRLLSLERSVCEFGIWKLGSQNAPSQNLTEIQFLWFTVPRLCPNNMVSEHLLSFWESGITACARQEVPIWATPVNPKVSDELSWAETSHVLLHFCCWGKSMVCVTPYHGREHKEACMWIPPNCAGEFPPYYTRTIPM